MANVQYVLPPCVVKNINAKESAESYMSYIYFNAYRFMWFNYTKDCELYFQYHNTATNLRYRMVGLSESVEAILSIFS